MLQDSIKLTGRLSIKKFNEKGELIETKEVPNLVVTAGKEFIASRIISNDNDVMNYMAVGADSSLAAVTQTSLVIETARVQLDSAVATGVNVVFSALFPSGTATGHGRGARRRGPGGGAARGVGGRAQGQRGRRGRKWIHQQGRKTQTRRRSQWHRNTIQTSSLTQQCPTMTG